MDKFLRLLSIFRVVTTLLPALSSRPHSKEDAIGLVHSTVNTLIEDGFLPESLSDVTTDEIADVLEFHSQVALADPTLAVVVPKLAVRKKRAT